MKTVSIPSRSRELLYSKVADRIRSYIESRGLVAGDKLPSERQLAAMLGASRNSVREALREMENQQIITVSPSRGSFVTGDSLDRSMVLHFVSKNFLEQLEVKMLVETQIVRHAVFFATLEQKKELLEIAKQLVALGETGFYPEHIDMIFHQKLSCCTPNQVMAEMIRNTIAIFVDYWHEFFEDYWKNMSNTDHSLARTLPFHLDLAYAIMDGDEEGAVRAYHQIYEMDVLLFKKIQK